MKYSMKLFKDMSVFHVIQYILIAVFIYVPTTYSFVSTNNNIKYFPQKFFIKQIKSNINVNTKVNVNTDTNLRIKSNTILHLTTNIIMVGKKNGAEKFISDGYAEYEKRLVPVMKINLIFLKSDEGLVEYIRDMKV